MTPNDIRDNLYNLPQIVFELTDACNLRCKYCGYAGLYEGYDKREDKMMPFSLAKNILDYLWSLWSVNYDAELTTPLNIGFYGGEPLLNFSLIVKIIDYVSSLPNVGKTFYYNMTTNALLLDRYMDYIVEHDFRLTISLDGDESCQGYRVDAAGQNSFDRVYKNICMLRDKYPDYFASNVNFNSVLHNKNSVERIYDFIESEFGKKPRVSPLTTSGLREDKIEEFNATYRNYYDDIKSSARCEELQERLHIKNPETDMLLRYIFYRTGNVFQNYTSLFLNKEKLPAFQTGTCIPFSKKMFVTVNGRILQCERINQEFSLGYVDDKGVYLDFEKVVNQFNGYLSYFSKQCSKCLSASYCTHCILQNDKDLHKKSCSSFKSMRSHDKFKSTALAYLSKHPALYSDLLEHVVIK